MAGYGSDDGDYYSEGGWGEEDNGGYYSDDHWEQQEFGDYDNVSESHLGTGRDDNHEEQDDSEGSCDEYNGMKSEEVNDEPGHRVRGFELPGIVNVIPGQDGLQQTMTGGIGKQSGVDGGRHPMTSYEWSSRTRHQDKQTGDYASSMAGYISDDGDYYSEGGWGEEDNGGYYSDDHWEQQEFGDYDNVSESLLGSGRDHNHEEQDDSEGSYDEYEGTKSEEMNDEPGHGVGGLELPGIVIVIAGQDGPQQTMTGGMGKQSGVDGGRRPMTSYEWSSRTRHRDKQTGDYASSMAGYGSDDGDYYSDGGWGVEDSGGYYSDDHWEQQEFGDYVNVSESLLGSGRDVNHEEQDDSEGSYDEYEGTKSEEVNDEPGNRVGGLELPGIVIVIPGQDGLQQTMTGGIGKQSGVDIGRHPMTNYEWSSRTRHQDKQTGDYVRAAMKHTFTSGDTFKERSTGRVGFKDEYKQSTTVTIGNKGGYSEHHQEERFRTVNFGKSSGSSSGGSSSTNKKI